MAIFGTDNNDNKSINETIKEFIGGTVGAGAGGAVSFVALSLGGKVAGLSAAGITSGLAAAGGSMLAGMAVLAAPPVILACIGVSIAAHLKDKQG